mgnify:CR=1 FL=1
MIQANENGNIAAKPTVHSFNAALNACAFVDGDTAQKADAFEVALKIYNLLQEYDAPDQTTYGTMIRACSGLLASNDKRREETVEEITPSEVSEPTNKNKSGSAGQFSHPLGVGATRDDKNLKWQ